MLRQPAAQLVAALLSVEGGGGRRSVRGGVDVGVVVWLVVICCAGRCAPSQPHNILIICCLVLDFATSPGSAKADGLDSLEFRQSSMARGKHSCFIQLVPKLIVTEGGFVWGLNR